MVTPKTLNKGLNRTYTLTTSATPSIDTDLYNNLELTAQDTNITSLSITGTPKKNDRLNIKITKAINSDSTFIGSSTTSGTSGSGYSVTLAKPTNTQENDIMFAHICIHNGGNVTVVPSGWALVTSGMKYWGANTLMYVYYKVATASEPASYTWTEDTLYANLTASMVTMRGGFDLTNPVDVYSSLSYDTSDNIIRAGSVTTKYNNENIFIFECALANLTISAYPTGFTERVTHYATHRISTASKKLGVLGATGNLDSTMSGTTTQKHAFAVTLNPEYKTIVFDSSFMADAFPLPTKFGEELNLDFIYDDTLSKYKTIGETNFITGSGAPLTSPKRLGQFYYDISGNKLYISKDTLYSSDWNFNFKLIII